jgi:small GTP-binding protein
MNIARQQASDAFHDYARLKLDLATIVRSLLHVAERSKDDTSIHDCRRVLARLAEDRFNLAIMGQFSRGKSSLMNALLGSEKLPTGILPLTSVITTVTYGETERVLLQRDGWRCPEEIRLDQLAEYVTQDRNPGNEKRVVLAEVQLPNELLRLGVHFVDTPGVASSILANTRTTRQFLPEADAVILVTSFDSPMTEGEVTFLREVRDHVRKVFIVVNKLDLAETPERGPVLDAVRTTVLEVLTESQPEVFAVSARQALRAKQCGSNEELAQSGFPALETALSEFLRTGKSREFFLRAADRTTQICRQQELAIRISKRAGNLEEAAILEGRLGDLAARLTEDCQAMISSMQLHLPRQFLERCKAAVAPLWDPLVEAFLASEIEAWFASDQNEMSGRAFEEFLKKIFLRLFSDWLSRHQQQIDSVFQELIRMNDAVEDLAGRVAALPANVLQEAGTYSADSFASHTLMFRRLDVPLANVQVPWWYELVPTGRWRNYLARRWRNRAAELAATYQEASSKLLETAVNDWIERLDREVGTGIRRASENVRRLLEQETQPALLSELEHLLIVCTHSGRPYCEWEIRLRAQTRR